MEWRWNVHLYYQHHNLGPPHHFHNKNSIKIYIQPAYVACKGCWYRETRAKDFQKKTMDSYTNMAPTQKKEILWWVQWVKSLVIHGATNAPSTKVGLTTDKKWFFWPKQPFPPEFLQVHLWPPDSLPPKKASFKRAYHYHWLWKLSPLTSINCAECTHWTVERPFIKFPRSSSWPLLCLKIIFASNHYFLLLANVKPKYYVLI